MRKLPLIALLLLVATGTLVSIAKSSRWDELARDRKAGYFFLEGKGKEYEDSQDVAFELVKGAFEANPDDKYISMEYGAYLISTGNTDSLELTKGLALIGDYVNSNPADIYAAMMYTSVTDYLGMPDVSIAVLDRLKQYHPDNTTVSYALVNSLLKSRDSVNYRRVAQLYDTLYIATGKSPGVFLEKDEAALCFG